MADLSEHLTVSDLEFEALTRAGDYRALAAVGKSDASESEEATEQLAFASAHDEAFRWLWVVQSEDDHDGWVELADSMPDSVEVPSSLRGPVSRFILEGADHLADGRAALLATLDPEFSLVLARKIALDDDLLAFTEIVDAALKVFGASAKLDDRATFFAVLDGLEPFKQIEGLAFVQSKKQRGEQAQMVVMLVDAIPALVNQGTPPNAEALSRAMGRLSAKARVEVLEAIPAHGELQRQTITAMAKYRPGVIGSLLDCAVEPALAGVICNAAVQALPPSVLAPILVKHHAGYPSSCFVSGRAAITQRINENGDDRGDLVEQYWEIVGASSEDQPADDLSALIEPSDLAASAGLSVTSTQWRQIGRVFGSVMDQHAEDDYFDSFIRLADSLVPTHKKQHAEFAVGVLQTADSYDDFSDPVLRHFACTREAVSAVLGDSETDAEAVVIGAEAAVGLDSTSGAAVDAFCIGAAEALDDAQIGRVSALIVWQEESTYERYVDCLAAHPSRMAAELTRAIESWSQKTALRIPTAPLVQLIDAALGANVPVSVTDETALGKLLSHRDESVPKAMARLIVASDDLSELTVNAVIEADRDSSGKVKVLGELRRTLGERLVVVAEDPHREIRERISALELAADTSAEAARAAAFRQAEDDDTELRSAAVSVLVRTPDTEGDEERLDQLIESENSASIGEELKRARRAISMSTIDEALERLVSLIDVGRKFDDLPNAEILLPDQRWHKTFINDTNDLRRANYEFDSPRNFINVACSLTELMAKQALVARHGIEPTATSLSDTTVANLRTNAKHVKLGTLLRNDLNAKTFPWFSPLMSLNYYRNVHGARIGDTAPPKLGRDEYSEVLVYLRQVFLGWVESMYEADDLAKS